MEIKRKNETKIKEGRYKAEKQLILDSLSKVGNELQILKNKIQELKNKTVKKNNPEFKENSKSMFANTNEGLNKNMTTSNNNNNNENTTANINKNVALEETILIMDSNRMHIDQRKFSRGHTLRKIKAGDIEEAHKVIDENEFKKAKYIIVHVGTNEVEKVNIASEISKDMIKLGVRLKTLYPSKEIFISQLPPGNIRLNRLTQNINDLLKNSLPESLNLVDNSLIPITVQCDKKHIKKDSIGILVYNMKKAIRSTFDIGDDRGKEIRRQEHTYRKKEVNEKRRQEHTYRKKEVNEKSDDKEMLIIKSRLVAMIDSMKKIVNGDEQKVN